MSGSGDKGHPGDAPGPAAGPGVTGSVVARWLMIPERHPGRTIAAVGLLFALAYGASLVLLAKPTGRIVIGDAVHYYVYLRSAVFDGDLRFRDEYVRIYGLRGGEEGTEWVHEPTATGHTRNLMSIGPAIAWTPLYLLAAAGAWLTHALGLGGAPDGYGRLFQASAGLSGVLAATLGAYVAYRAARRLFDARTAIWSTLVTWLGSHAIYYSLVSPTYSHAISMLTVGLFIAAWLVTRDRQSVSRYAVIGALGGLAALVRWQDAVLLIVPAVDALWHALTPAHAEAVPPTFGSGGQRPVAPAGPARGAPTMSRHRGAKPEVAAVRPYGTALRLRDAAVNLLACGAAAVVAFLPQMLVWYTLYGSPFLVPQGDEFMRWTSPSLVLVLFSDWHGLFTWTPVVVLSLAGLVLLARREPMIATALGAAFLVSWYANAAVADWWAGEAYGARRFVSCFPIFVIGLAAAARPLAARLPLLAAVAAVVIGLNGLLLLQYQTFMHGLRAIAPYPRGAYELWLARFVVPFELLKHWLQR